MRFEHICVQELEMKSSTYEVNLRDFNFKVKKSDNLAIGTVKYSSDQNPFKSEQLIIYSTKEINRFEFNKVNYVLVPRKSIFFLIDKEPVLQNVK
jgi:hypothetical protein